MIKTILLLLVSLLFYPSPVQATDEFDINQTINYQLQTNQVQVTHQLKLKNKFSKIYATQYSLDIISQNKITNIKAFNDQNEPLTTNVNRSNRNITKITVEFKEPVTGRDEVQQFRLQYNLDNFVEEVGQTYRVLIPKITDIDQFNNLTVKITAPQNLGAINFTSPKNYQYQQEGEQQIISFNKESLVQKKVMVIFGEVQNLAFHLTYFLKNDSQQPDQKSIALPPDTGYQTVFLEKITPEPTNVYTDKDDNWLAQYHLQPNQELTVEVDGYAHVTANPTSPPYQPEDFQPYLEPQPYWPINDPAIQEIAQSLNTPAAVYQYVIDTLDYNLERAATKDIERLGAKEALAQPDQAICMEFTDLFVTLARAAGIPAREINGYAYSSQSELIPSTSYSDILHAWPEYWDSQNKTWRQVDPSWESTTQIDYFNKMDMTHLAFVVHGHDSQQPLPAGAYQPDQNKQKTINVSFGQMRVPGECQPQLEIDAPNHLLPFEKRNSQITITNPCSQAFYPTQLEININGTTIDRQQHRLKILPPFARREFDFNLTDGSSLSSLEMGNKEISAALSFASADAITAEQTIAQQLLPTRLNQLISKPVIIFPVTVIACGLLTWFLVKKFAK